MSRLPLLGTISLLFACAVGPDYKRPETTASQSWASVTSDSFTAEHPEIARWWTCFNDPILESTVERAIHANLDLRLAVARLKEARAQAAASGADLWPKLDATGSYSRTRASENLSMGSFPSVSGNLYQVGFDALWEVDLFGGIRRTKEAAVAQAESIDEARRDTLVTVIADVARSYVELRALQRRLSIAKQNIEAQTEAARITDVRFRTGISSELDFRQAETVVSATRATVPQLEAEIARTVHRLSILAGELPNGLAQELSGEVPIPALPERVAIGIPSELLRRRPDIRRAERALASATARIGVATSELFPKITLTAGYGLQSSGAGTLFEAGSQYWIVRPGVRWPIFSAGKLRANIRVEKAREEIDLVLYEKTVLQSFEEVENALVTFEREKERLKQLDIAARASRRAFELANKQYLNGLVDFLNVAQAELALVRAEDELVQSERGLAVGMIVLFKALGGGWEWELETQKESQNS